MSRLLNIFFAMIFSIGHGNTTHHADTFVPPSEFAGTSYKVPITNHYSLARRNVLNSYSEDACLSCRTTNSISQPQLILRAQR